MKISSFIVAAVLLSSGAMAQNGNETADNAPKWNCKVACEKGSSNKIALGKVRAETNVKNVYHTSDEKSAEVKVEAVDCEVNQKSSLREAHDALQAAVVNKAPHCSCTGEFESLPIQCSNNKKFPPKWMAHALIDNMLKESQGQSNAAPEGK